MDIYRLFFTLVLFFLLCQSCGEEPSSQEALKNINPLSIPSNRALSTELDDIQYIPLNSEGKAYLSQIKKILYHQDYLIVLCFQRAAIYFFDHNGDFKFMISPKGRAPLAFSSAHDITLLNNHTILICDNELSKILQFDIYKKTIVEEWKLESPPFAIESYKDYIYILCNDPDGSIKVVQNLDFENIEKFVKPSKVFNLISSPKPFTQYNDTLFLNVGFSDTIYYATSNKVSPYAAIGEGQNAISNINTEDITNAVFSRDKIAMRKIKNVYIPTGFFSIVNDKWIIPLLTLNFILYDKESGLATLVNSKSITNLELLSGGIIPMIYCQDNQGYFYSSFIPTLPFYEELEKLPETNIIKKAAKKGLGALYNDDSFENPIVIRFKPNKDFLELIEK